MMPGAPRVMTWAEALEHLYAKRFTGGAVVHFHEGKALVVELPGPPERIRIDNKVKMRQTAS